MTPATRPLALVTGASSGIGIDLARELARDGHDLVLSARRVEPMQTLAEELKAHGATAHIIGADLSKPGSAAALVEELQRRGLNIDVLINNAGLGANGWVHEIDPIRVSEMLQVNVVALTELTRLLLPGMLARDRGGVMLVGSTAGFQPGPNMAIYCATKAYVLSLGEALSYELRNSAVTVTTLCPGVTATGFAAVARAGDTALFGRSSLPVMSSAEVARIGYRAFKAHRRVVVTGWRNKFTAFFGRFSPHFVSLPITNKLMSPH